MRILALTALALLGCNNAGLPASPPTGDTQSGLYQVTVETNADDCTPPAVAGDAGTTLLSRAASGIEVGIPEGPGFARYDLAARSNFAFDGSRPLQGCPANAVREALQLLSDQNDTLQVSAIEDWTVNAPCAPDALETAPAQTCHADRTITYRFLTACTNPVRVNVDFSGHVTCD